MSSKPDIFLSYNRDDQATARKFAEGFERAGFSVWWDQALKSGIDYDKATEQALRGAKAVVVLWSKRSVDSRWVRTEATIALQCQTLVPVTIEPCQRPIMFELTQTADLCHWQGDANDPVWLTFVQDVQQFVNGVAANAATKAPLTRMTGAAARRSKSPLAWSLSALFALSTTALLWPALQHWQQAPPAEIRFQIARPTNNGSPFISPDGQRIAFVQDGGSLVIRELNALELHDLPLTRHGAPQVVWAPDSRSLVYQSNDLQLMKVAIDGSPPVQLAGLPLYGGGSWSQDGILLVSTRSDGLQRIPATGGQLTPVTTLAAGETEHLSPQFIGGDRFLFRVNGDKAVAGIYVASLAQPAGKLVLPIANANYAYVPPLPGASEAHIVYVSQNVLVAQAVDPSSLSLKGAATTLANNVTGLSASLNGTLVYLPRDLDPSYEGLHQWVDRSGNKITDTVIDQEALDVTVSPSGKRWARSLDGNLWLHDLNDNSAPTPFAFDMGDERFLAWSPDEQWIAYASGNARAHDRILKKNTVTMATAETVLEGGADFTVHDWSRDGKTLLFAEAGNATGSDLWTLDMQSPGAKPVPYLQTVSYERHGVFSPDGHWIAYISDESGQSEVYVQSFPPGAGKFQVSNGGGTIPRWRADGQELFFVSGANMVAVTTRTSPLFVAGGMQPLFKVTPAVGTKARNYDVTPDGNRFLVLVDQDAQELAPATIIVNWQAGMQKPQ